jgi:hypothetical protein
MTTTQILIAILSSSLLSAALTSGVNYYLTSVNYKNEYYKKLLDNRLLAYQDIYNFLNQLKMMIHDTEESTVTPYLLTKGVSELEKIIIEILLPIKNSIWVSDQVSEELTRLNVLLHNLLNKAETFDDPDKALTKIGYEYIGELRSSRKEIERLMRSDFKNMHNIQTFFTDRS